MTLREVLDVLAGRRAELARLSAHVDGAALLAEVVALLEQVDGMATENGPDLTTAQAAARLGLGSARTVERFCRAGRFAHAYRLRGQRGAWRIPPGDVVDFRRGDRRPRRSLSAI